MSEEQPNIIYPENIDQVSVLNESVKSPLGRISLAEESSADIFNNPKTTYGAKDSQVTYIISDIVRSEEDSDCVNIIVTDVDFPDRVFYIEIPIQYANTAFLLSQMVKTPMFFIVPSDDMVGSLGYGPYQKSEIHTVIEAPQRKTPEFNKITKLLFNLSKPTEDENRSVVISGEQIDNVRIELIDIILGLIEGKPESLMKVYSHAHALNRTNEIDSDTEVSDEDKYGIVMKDFLLKLEEETHPIYFTTLFRQGANALQYVSDIEKFELMLNDMGLNDDFIKDLDTKININSETSEEDLITYYSKPIKLENVPNKIRNILQDIDNQYHWEFNWNTALEEEVNFKDMEAGDFFTAMLIVIAIRLSRLEEMYEAKQKSLFSPLALMITALTSPGEDFMWIVRESVKLLAHDKQDTLYELLTIPNDIEGRSPYSGPLGIVLHGIAHAALDSGLSLESISLALKDMPNVVAFISLVMETYESLPEQIKEAGEIACFIKGLILPNMGDEPLSKEEAKEIIDAVMVMAEMNVMKNTEASINTQQWYESLESFYKGIV